MCPCPSARRGKTMGGTIVPKGTCVQDGGHLPCLTGPSAHASKVIPSQDCHYVRNSHLVSFQPPGDSALVVRNHSHRKAHQEDRPQVSPALCAGKVLKFVFPTERRRPPNQRPDMSSVSFQIFHPVSKKLRLGSKESYRRLWRRVMPLTRKMQKRICH